MTVLPRLGSQRVALVAACAAVALGAAAPAAAADTAGSYVVQLDAPSLATYTGGTRAIPATSPARTGSALRPRSSAARRYRAFLDERQRAVVARAPGSPQVTHAYRTAFAGFSARLTPDQLAAVEADPRVANVFKDGLQQPLQAPPGSAQDAALGGITGGAASYLRLPTGLWQRLGGVDRAGEGVIVGVIDTGITPGHPSFADDPADGYQGPAYAPPEVWNGACQGGDGFPTSSCTAKLIGARYFVAGFGTPNLADGAFISPRDDDGHGTHTASTAAGNFGVDPSIDGNDLGVDVVSGIAPRAYVAAYKVCWPGREDDGCAESDSVAAIDAAVADGVDVINYSIGSAEPDVLSPSSIAMFGAAAAGVFTAVSAGNTGPDAGTIGSPAGVPWVTTVGANATRQAFEATLTVTGPAGTLAVTGASVGRGLPASPLVDGAASGAPGVDPEDAAGCLPGTLDPARVAGNVVLCFGNRMRAVRARAVEEAGGVGIVLANPEGGETLFTDNHRIPGIHISHADGLAVQAAIAPGTTAALGAAGAVARPRGAIMADFSSRGPQDLVGEIAKPDLTAPGVQILAGAAPLLPPDSPFLPGQLFQVISGTSMSSPVVAGAAALLKQQFPLLTPAELKSALMTTANPAVLLEDGTTPAGPFAAGSGEVDPNPAGDPGLVLDTTPAEYLGYLEGVDPALVTGVVTPIEATDLNLPSVAIEDFIGIGTTTRVFRSVAPRLTTWTVQPESTPGLGVTVGPRRFTVRPGQRQRVTISVTPTSATGIDYGRGAVVLTSGSRRLRLPVQARPRVAQVPATVQVTAAAADGSAPVTVVAGFTGALHAFGWGLAVPEVDVGETVTRTSGQPDLSGTDAGTNLYPVTVPEGAQLVAARIANADGGAAGTDIDLYLFRDPDADGDFEDAELVDFENDVDSDEFVAVPVPEPGEYVWAVLGFATRVPVSTYDFTRWLVDDPAPDDPAPPPGLVVSGDGRPGTAGEEVELSLDWSAVTTPGTHLGLITYAAEPEPTIEDVRALSLVELTRTGAAP